MFSRTWWDAGRLWACALVIGFVGVARADLVGPMFVLDVSNGDGQAQFVIELDPNCYDPNNGSWNWQLPEPVQIRDPQNQALLAVLEQAAITIFQDPAVNLGFSVTAGASDTVFQVYSALLPISPPLTNPDGRASAAFTVTDINGNGALLTGLGGASGTKAYLAHYNGFVPGGTPFAEEITSVAAGPWGSGSAASNVPPVGYLPIAGTVSDMSAGVHFSLSARDYASGTSNYEIIPEPATLWLLVVGALALRARARL